MTGAKAVTGTIFASSSCGGRGARISAVQNLFVGWSGFGILEPEPVLGWLGIE
jgi:hypothetical protein